jgi:hypothetical protein
VNVGSTQSGELNRALLCAKSNRTQAEMGWARCPTKVAGRRRQHPSAASKGVWEAKPPAETQKQREITSRKASLEGHSQDTST